MNKHGYVDLRKMTDQAVYNAMEKRRKAAGVKKFSPHDFRRTCITTLLREGADLFAVQDLAGHADLSTTKRYDKRGEDAKKKAAGRIRVPYVEPSQD